jgi:hypothetical protein
MATSTISLTRRGLGYTITKKGYRRITSGPDRHQYAHRLKAKRCMEESGLILTSDLEVDHLCANKECDEDFHLLILPGCLHDSSNVNGCGKKNARRI